MKKNIKHLIKEINEGKNLDKNLPVYVDTLTHLYYEMSLLHLTMDYVTLYEMVTEYLPYEERIHIAHTLDCINQVVKDVFRNHCDLVKLQECLDLLEKERNEVIKKMQELTTHIDRVMIYEYVLNHMKYKYQDDVVITLEEEEAFIKRVFKYIFASRDNQIINENIKEVIAELPIRMSRKHYFKLLKESIGLYTGSDRSAVDTYLYMLHSSAMLYQPNADRTYFEEFDQLVEKLGSIDYEHLDQNFYQEILDLQIEGAKRLANISDLYVKLQEVINNLYAFLLAMSSIDMSMKATPLETEMNKKEIVACKEIVNAVSDLFEAKKQEPVSDYINEKLIVTEGKQEEDFFKRELLESVLEEIYSHQKEPIDRLMLGTQTEKLYRISQLMSVSIFIEFGDRTQELADEAYIADITENFLSKITQLFQKNSVCVNRAVIANTLNKMPVFFQSIDEVVQYIQNSMSQCQDQGEKFACMQFLNEMMGEL